MLHLRQFWYDIRASLWFLPSILVLLAVLLGVGLVEADLHMDKTAFERWPLLFGSGADGARGLLATVASSMITVAGVAFSITVVALSLTSSQYSSRVLRNFMADRVNQFVLGSFVGIFAYCLVVLRTIRGGDEGAFVPSLAVLVGLGLAFCGVAVLIYFIHHISTSIQASHILATVAGETNNAIDHLFPEGAGEETPGPGPAAGVGKKWWPIPSRRTGYIQSLDAAGLIRFAAGRQGVVRMERAVGQFVAEGVPLASLLAGAEPGDEAARELDGLYAVGRQRTIDQDAAFGIRQIVDVALKALSPGVNDTTTAVMCVDYLSAILLRLTGRRIESRFRGEDGEFRLLTSGPSYGGLVTLAFDQVRQNAGGNVAVLASLLGAVEVLAAAAATETRRAALAAQADAAVEQARRTLPAAVDLEVIELAYARARGPLAPGAAAVAYNSASNLSMSG